MYRVPRWRLLSTCTARSAIISGSSMNASPDLRPDVLYVKSTRSACSGPPGADENHIWISCSDAANGSPRSRTYEKPLDDGIASAIIAMPGWPSPIIGMPGWPSGIVSIPPLWPSIMLASPGIWRKPPCSGGGPPMYDMSPIRGSSGWPPSTCDSMASSMAVLANCAAPRAMGLHRGVHGVGTRTAATTSLASRATLLHRISACVTDRPTFSLLQRTIPYALSRGEPLGTSACTTSVRGRQHTPSQPTHPHRISGLSQRDPHYTSDGRARARAVATKRPHTGNREAPSVDPPSVVDPGAARRAPPPARRLFMWWSGSSNSG